MNALRTDQDKKLNIILWIVGIAFTAFLSIGAVQMISFGEVKAKTVENSIDIEKIRGDYASYDLVIYIIESNNKVVNVLNAIQDKDEDRYKNAMIEWNKLQQDIIKQAGINKRGGGISSQESIE